MGERHILLWVFGCVVPCSCVDGAFSSCSYYRSLHVSSIALRTLAMLNRSSFIWGALLMLTATCFNAEGLLAIRLFLGAAEAAIGPGLTVIVAMWYKRSEQPLRHGAWFMGNVVAGIFGGILAYGIGHVRSIEPWKVGSAHQDRCVVLTRG